MLTPVEFRSLIGVDDDVCLYYTAARTVFTRKQLTDLWDMARIAGNQLAVARSRPAVVGASAATEAFIGVDATPEDAKDFMIRSLGSEAFASNLRVLDMGRSLVVRPVAIWGPAILVQVQGQNSAGVATFNGQLRIVSASHDPLPDYLDRVRDVLEAACWARRLGR
jgi:hypothetical protein